MSPATTKNLPAPGGFEGSAKLAKLEHGQRQDRQICPSTTVADAAEMLNVSERTVKAARIVQRDAVPELTAAKFLLSNFRRAIGNEVVERAASRERLARRFEDLGNVAATAVAGSELPRNKEIAAAGTVGIARAIGVLDVARATVAVDERVAVDYFHLVGARVRQAADGRPSDFPRQRLRQPHFATRIAVGRHLLACTGGEPAHGEDGSKNNETGQGSSSANNTPI